jgi:hypothetical protein
MHFTPHKAGRNVRCYRINSTFCPLLTTGYGYYDTPVQTVPVNVRQGVNLACAAAGTTRVSVSGFEIMRSDFDD